jgi:cyanate lyase
MMIIYGDDPKVRELIREAWNDGYQSAVSNALEAELITEQDADELLEELTNN